ncbi:MAG TPA: hypothetical protein VMB21_18645, partial [Candidatus Limnocylindria bacterium]|nr:hypothetical protein [Candidatus Limnocylindria bacterium]
MREPKRYEDDPLNFVIRGEEVLASFQQGPGPGSDLRGAAEETEEQAEKGGKTPELDEQRRDLEPRYAKCAPLNF